jgi:hypothetical protein
MVSASVASSRRMRELWRKFWYTVAVDSEPEPTTAGVHGVEDSAWDMREAHSEGVKTLERRRAKKGE